MKKTILTLLSFFLFQMSFGQTNNNEKFIELAKIYNDFMFRNEPTKNILKDLKLNVAEDLKVTNDFITQTISTKNKLLSEPFLSRPDNNALKQIFIIRQINLNLREENHIDNNLLIDSLMTKEISVYELVDNYYDMLFTAVGNKNQPFDFSNSDFNIKDFNLKDDTEKGIFFLRCMNLCGVTIWGYMNVVKPANTQKAFYTIQKYPKFNGSLYYQYTDFYFNDFEINIIRDKGLQSYKSYFLDKYYETLLYHLLCLNKENRSEKEKNDLLLGSILKERNLYKYTKHKELLEEIFKEKKRD
ncbi:hypothetical protein [Flavobacterium sp. H122]|uniref:hypothetical protein n=1 Tax=Flavobacterium sp. H122 TaxID=2529860 RepID=UPI0010AB38D8|nr:hypothetical protein [Flavobacterium sp. H122]